MQELTPSLDIFGAENRQSKIQVKIILKIIQKWLGNVSEELFLVQHYEMFNGGSAKNVQGFLDFGSNFIKAWFNDKVSWSKLSRLIGAGVSAELFFVLG